jgi:asparagine synthase (glutamine-hydrolysing)
MCGIAGFYSQKQHFNRFDLETMTQILSHRGPDAEGYFFDGVCGLGHRRLSILDTSDRANQPMASHNDRYVMVYNGEVYNYQEITRGFAQTEFRTTSDTEVILEAFVQKYAKFVYQLNGMFAIAIYDRQEKALFLFRDRIGIKPLYYYWDEEHFAFASELKSLLQLSIERNLNDQAVADYLHLGYVPAPKSIFKNIYKLPSGHWIRLQGNKLELNTYWTLQDKIYDKATQEKLVILNKEKEAKDQLKKLLSSSVQYRLISDVPVGVFLSGGIDSSTVAALAVENSTTKINTFSIGFQENEFNESQYARQVAQHLGTNHEEFTVSIREAKELIPHLIDLYDEPFADSSAIPTFMVSQLAREYVKVALGGDGGDELFFGYGMYQWASRLSNPLWQAMRSPLALGFGMFQADKYQKAKSLLKYTNKKDLASHIFSQEQHLFSFKELNELMTHPPSFMSYGSQNHNRELTPMEAQALFDLELYLQDDLLVKVDRASMRNSLEARVPLLDHRVIEFAINLSPDLKYKKGESKYLLKQVLYDYLPKELFKRPKRGFSIPLADWLATDLSYLMDDYLNKNIIEMYGIVKYEVVHKMKEKFLKGNTYYYNRLWALIVLHQFLIRNYT